VEGVEALEVLGQVLPAGVGLRDHHHHRVRERAAREHEQLEDVVERRGIRAALADDRDDLVEVAPEQRGGELRLARPHPVLVAHERVDLAVVGDHAVGWLSSQLGNVFVENRECTSAMPDANAGSCRSGK
jgi:hypothetical protein